MEMKKVSKKVSREEAIKKVGTDAVEEAENKAREVSALQDIYEEEKPKFISLDYDETRFCDYLEAASITTPGLYVSEESTGEHKLIHDKDTKNEMKNEEDFALSAIKGNKSDSEIDNHFKELMETGLTYTAAGINTAYLGEGSNIVIANNGSHSPELDEFIKKVKTNNDGANKLDTYAKSKTDLTDELRKLADEAWGERDKQNIKIDMGLTDINKNQEEKKEKLENAEDNYEKEYTQGKADAMAGLPKAKNTEGYNIGYFTGKRIFEEIEKKVVEEENLNLILDKENSSSKILDSESRQAKEWENYISGDEEADYGIHNNIHKKR